MTTAKKKAIQWVPIEKMRVREGVSQREFRPAWANQLASDFDPEAFTPPIVNRVGAGFWIVDGQHRTWAAKQALGEDQKLECWVHHDLSEKEEAELFLSVNTVKAVGSFDKFTIGVTAEREIETNIAALVRKAGLKISQKKRTTEGTISCVGTLGGVYRRCGMEGLAEALDLAYQSFGDPGLEADVIGGMGLLVSRYNGKLEPKKAIKSLAAVRGGVNAVRTRAERLRQQTGHARGQCIAAACVEVINRGRGGKKLPSWWKTDGTNQ